MGAVFFFSSRRRHTRCLSDWSSDVCSSDLRSCHRAARGSRLARNGETRCTLHGGVLSPAQATRSRRVYIPDVPVASRPGAPPPEPDVVVIAAGDALLEDPPRTHHVNVFAIAKRPATNSEF